ncbi:DUF1501 domain-containing protein [uncultured Aquabacterium sp.]|uniref:DUF1501 domain-containing protein n=1 Tax=uncultured Aquabacterium sp. TaxID=158753 RepID=UPI0030D4F7BA|tara:strand:- start:1307 stop:2803 length:1497 start_codon:yes stop_codon:yes gene_type:complete
MSHTPFPSDAPSPQTSRRDFLRRGGALSLGATLPAWGMNLAAMAASADAAAALSNTGDGYKALVCVFLQGGNDHANTVVPVDASGHALYARLRGALATPRAQLLPLSPLATAPAVAGLGGGQLALSPALPKLQRLFNTERRLAVLLNIGPLQRPTTLAQFRARSVALPPKLFSHNDQQSVWQSHAAEGSTVGWGGVIGDQGLLLNRAAQATESLSCVNLAGNAVYLAGQQAGQFMVNPLGPDRLLALQPANMLGSQDCVDAFKALVGTQEPAVHRLAKEHSAIMRRAMDTNAVLLDKLSAITVPAERTQPSGNPLADQLRTAVRIMAAHSSLGLRRQVFFVSLGGFDLHDNLSGQHPVLLAQLDEALAQLDTDLDALQMRDQVTAFTASDFGRTLSSNGDGSDHGWGSHHFVMGGAVQGGRFWGDWPEVTDHDSGAQNIGQGRLLPTMAVDHLAEALARWMGVTEATLLDTGAKALDRIAPHRSAFAGNSPLTGLLTG